MNKKLLEQLEQRTRSRLNELKEQMEKGEVRAEDFATIQAEVAKLGEELQGIVDALAALGAVNGEENAEGEARAEDAEADAEADAEKEAEEAAAEQRSAVMMAIGSALSTRNAHPTKRKETEVRSAFANFVIGKISETEARALGIETGNGSVTVPEVIASEIISYAQSENLLRKYGTVHRTKGNVKFPVLVKKMDANVRKKERGVGDEIEETAIEFDEILLSPSEFDALATVTKKLLKMSGAPVERIVIDELKKAYVRKETNYMFNGDDAGNENEGALAKKSVQYYEKVAVEIEKEGWSQRLYAELVKLKNQPVTEIMKKSIWIVNRAALTLLESMVDATGRPLLHVDATDGVSYKLLGHKLDFTDAADAKDSGVPVFYFGDFKAFHIQDVVGSMEIQKMVEQYARTNRVGFQIYNLLDGQLIYSPFEPAVYRYEVGATAPVGGGSGAPSSTPTTTETTTPTTTTTTGTPTPAKVELRALKQGEVTKRQDNNLDTFTVATDGTLTTNREMKFGQDDVKTVAFLPETATELVFEGINGQHNILVSYDATKTNGVGVTIGKLVQTYNINMATGQRSIPEGGLNNITESVKAKHTYAAGNTYKFENKADEVVVSFRTAQQQTFTEWFKVSKTDSSNLVWKENKLGVMGGISPSNEQSQTLLKKAQINVQ